MKLALIIFLAFYNTAIRAQNSNLELAEKTLKAMHQGKYELSKPFILHHHKKTAKSILLIHGLSDSTYYMKDMSNFFYSLGWNVVAILLEGHGTYYKDLKKATHQAWMKQTKTGIRIAKLLGQEVYAGGFSTGATLAIQQSLIDKNIQGLFLVAPALGFHGNIEYATCYTYWLHPYVKTSTKTKLPIRYPKISTKGVCELNKLMNDLESKLKKNTKIEIPTYIAISAMDTVVSKEHIMDLYENKLSGEKALFHFDQQMGIPHGIMTDGSSNPYLKVMFENLKNFMKKNNIL